MTVVKIHDAKTNLSKLIARVEAGEEIIIARGDKPVVKLQAVNPMQATKRTPGSWKGKFTVPDSALEPLSDEELGYWDSKPAYGGFSE